MKTTLDRALITVSRKLWSSRVPWTSMDSIDVVDSESVTHIQRIEKGWKLEDSVGW